MSDRIARLYQSIQARIEAACQRAGRSVSSVRLVAVSKKRPNDNTRAPLRHRRSRLGENRVQDAREKIPQLPGDIRWHLIGPLQTNKAKYLPGMIACVQSIERIEVAEALDKAYAKAGARCEVLVQVNVAGEEQKSGCEPAEAEALVRAVAAMEHS
ncbi:MAG: YggS family pyridoxal phosphate-dependent enzyme, partial [Methylacidiphilales bacterium]|nr:YggS family pyridoxal phosphate-dependent enzyme [Candidatus Methylacidiphilales bacterium]